MDIGKNILLSPEADSVLGSLCDSGFAPPVEKDLFLSTVRYIAVKQASDVSEVKPIKISFWAFNPATINQTIENCSGEEPDIFIFQVGNDYEPPVFTKEGWISLDSPPYPVANFLSNISATTVYINNDLKKALVYAKRTTPTWVKHFCSSLFRIIPWVYPDNNSLDENDKEFFKAIHDGNWTKFTEIINEAAKSFDFKKLQLKTMLSDWGNAYKKSRINQSRQKEDRIRSLISDYQTKLAACYDDLYRITEDINAYMLSPISTDDELYRFFDNHKQLSIISVERNENGNTLKYCIIETIEFFDQDVFNKYFNNKKSYFHSHDICDDTRKIFFNIFAKEKGVFRTESVFQLTNLSSLNPLRETSSYFTKTAMPHPHLVQYSCLGHNRDIISQYLEDGNWELAIEQSIGATKNINFGDSTVMTCMLHWVQRNKTVKCILADNGDEMTPDEFLTYISKDDQNGQ